MNRIIVVPRQTPAPAASRHKAKVFERSRTARPMRLEDRDVRALEALAEHRFLSGDQLRRLVFTCGASTAARRLRLLYDHGLVDRLAVVAQPLRGVPPCLYTLGRHGAAALGELGLPVPLAGERHINLRTVRHRFLVNEFYVRLVESVRGTRHALEEWRHEERLRVPTQDGKGRAELVRHRLLTKAAPFLPDGYFVLRLADGARRAFFLELDRATHSLRIWRHRARLYSAYADPHENCFRRRFGHDGFHLLIVCPPDYRGRSRRDNILRTLREELAKPEVAVVRAAADADGLFLAATEAEALAGSLLGAVWRSATGRRVALVPQAQVLARPNTPVTVSRRDPA